MPDTLDSLDERQRFLVDDWFPGARLVADRGWGQVPRVVLQLAVPGPTAERQVLVKASGPGDRHVAGELRAHERWTAPLVAIGRAPRLLHGDLEARVMATDYLPGELVDGHRAQDVPDTFRQAGHLLRLFHGAEPVRDDAWASRLRDSTLRWLGRPHRIEPGLAARLSRTVERWTTDPVPVVPVHSDFQPRNWIVDDAATVSLIDFGGSELAPAMVDLVRLAAQDFARDPGLEEAFLAGYGSDPRAEDPQLWRRIQLAQAISTAAWAHDVGDEPFEAQGHRMIADWLASC